MLKHLMNNYENRLMFLLSIFSETFLETAWARDYRLFHFHRSLNNPAPIKMYFAVYNKFI